MMWRNWEFQSSIIASVLQFLQHFIRWTRWLPSSESKELDRREGSRQYNFIDAWVPGHFQGKS